MCRGPPSGCASPTPQTLTSLSDTVAKLALRRQTEKIRVYIALRRVLSVAMFCMFVLVGVALLTDQRTPALRQRCCVAEHGRRF